MDHVIVICWDGDDPQFIRGDDITKVIAKAYRAGFGEGPSPFPLDSEHWENLKEIFDEEGHGIFYNGPENDIMN